MKPMKSVKRKRVVTAHGYELPSIRQKGERSKATQSGRSRRLFGILFVIAILGGLVWWWQTKPLLITRTKVDSETTNNLIGPQASTGKITEQGVVQEYTPTQALELIRQTNPGYQGTPPALKSQTFRYTMTDTNGLSAQIYARVYVPVLTRGAELPVFAFAPGTTGIDDQCAASLEVPAKRNFANYASHMASYAAQGYVVVVTDYEGMRDPKRMHHYMVGTLEGRALLDAVRGVSNLTLTKATADLNQVFLAGYSQGGHAAFWADRLAANYAPELTIKGVVGYGPVTDVRQTLTDTTRGANILWFGPFVLYSYADWYKDSYDLTAILMPPYDQNLGGDIAKNCIDTVIPYWGARDINRVYTQPFIQAMKQGTLAQITPGFNDRLTQNLAADVKTSSAKLINHGRLDNVVLPTQSDAARKRLCQLGNQVTYRQYPDATHYTTMVKSFQETINWMKAVRAGSSVPRDCS